MLAVVGVGALMARAAARRTAAFQELAEGRRYRFSDSSNEWNGLAGHLRLFQQGHSKRLYNVLHGKQDASEVMLADYEYVTGSGRNRSKYTVTVCVVRTPGLTLPKFYLRPQRAIYDRLGKLFGGRDLDFEDDPEFSKAFVLQGEPAEAAVRKLFSPGVRERLRDWSNAEIWLEGGEDVVLLHHDKRIDPKDLERLATDAVTMRRLFLYDLEKGSVV